MKKNTKRLVAIILTFILVLSMLPLAASANQDAIILIELKEPYFGVDLSEIITEVKIEAAYLLPINDEGCWYEVFYDASSGENAEEVAEKIANNPKVRSAHNCDSAELSDFKTTVGFHIHIKNDCGFGYNVELGKLFPGMEIVKAKQYGFRTYDVFFNVSTMEEWDALYLKIKSNPFIDEVICHEGTNGGITVGRVTALTKKKCTPEEASQLFNYLGIYHVFCNNDGYYNDIYLLDNTIKGTYEAIYKLMKDPNVVQVQWNCSLSDTMVLPNDLEKSQFAEPERSEVTVKTALAALRIAAQLTNIKNDVYNCDLAYALWEFDCDGDNAITVADALALLREAVGYVE